MLAILKGLELGFEALPQTVLQTYAFLIESEDGDRDTATLVVKMVLANTAEGSVELEEVQRVMDGGRSTEPDIGVGSTNAKEWIFSKGETTWFMRYPKKDYDSNIANWQ